MGFDLGFGVIFVEHILCKVVQWQNRLVSNCGKKVSLIALGDVAAQDEGHWEKGANVDNASLFPIPLKMSEDCLMKLLVNGEQSLSFYFIHK